MTADAAMQQFPVQPVESAAAGISTMVDDDQYRGMEVFKAPAFKRCDKPLQ
jgi:hypothetical protein